ncbi:hypothetical protein TWF506_000105 [Arthrobotrys conoides]|uniref:Uncharacterized protein n=1 Tax=Arthrobotrys conoides TaxID=74498 RepID=A0AAN8RXA4_9PEZI
MDPRVLLAQLYSLTENYSESHDQDHEILTISPKKAPRIVEAAQKAALKKDQKSQYKPLCIKDYVYATVEHEGEDAVFKIIINTKSVKTSSVDIKYGPSGSYRSDHFLIELNSQVLQSFREDGDYVTFTFDHRAFFNIPEKFNYLPHYKILLNAKKDKAITLLVDTERAYEESRKALRSHMELLRSGSYENESSMPVVSHKLNRRNTFLSPSEYYSAHLDNIEVELCQHQALLDELFETEVDVHWDRVEGDDDIKCTMYFQHRRIHKMETWEPDSNQIFELSLPYLRRLCVLAGGSWMSR